MKEVLPFHRPKMSGPARCRGAAAVLLVIATVSAAWANPPRLQGLIVQLGSDDPQLRQDALSQLMGLKKQDLPALRAAALAQSPLLPGQIGALHQAVTQVFLAAEPYRVDAEVPGGFLGLRYAADPSAEGITVEQTIDGFAAHRLLQPGDVIVQILDYPAMPLHGNGELLYVMQRMWPGQTLHLKVLRLGRPINVALIVDFLPLELTRDNADAWIQRRNQTAEDYWKAEFSMLERGKGPGSTQASSESPA